MSRISAAWASWKASNRFLFWTWVEVLSGALSAKKVAAMELAGLNPKEPNDCFAAGYALFVYNLACDEWEGYWRDPSLKKGMVMPVEWRVRDWDGIPWHRVSFSDSWLPEHIRAVPLKWCRKHLGLWPILKVA